MIAILMQKKNRKKKTTANQRDKLSTSGEP
jgi:hypothetical protein